MTVKKTNEYTLKEAIDEMLKSYRLERKLNEAKLLSSWEKVMGGVIAKYTGDMRIENGTLFVEIKSAALKEELKYGKSKMLDLLNKEIGEEILKDIVLR